MRLSVVCTMPEKFRLRKGLRPQKFTLTKEMNESKSEKFYLLSFALKKKKKKTNINDGHKFVIEK